MDLKKGLAMLATCSLFVGPINAQDQKIPDMVSAKLTLNENEVGWMLWGVDFDKESVQKTLEDRHVKLPAGLPPEARVGLMRDKDRVVLVFEKSKDGKAILLTADVNQNNDLTDDRTVQLVMDEKNEQAEAVVKIERFLGQDRTHPIWLPYSFSYSIGKDKTGKSQEHYGYSTHYRMEGTVDVGSRRYRVCLWDLTMDGKYDQSDLNQGSAIAIDLDDNGKFFGRDEYFVAGKLIPLADTYYVVDTVAADGTEVVFRHSDLRPLKIGDPAPDFLLTDSSGSAFRLGDYRGRVVLLDFWASWCGFCLRAFPDVNDFAKKNTGKPFDIIGVDVDDAALLDKARQVIKKYGLTWREVMDGKGTSTPLMDRLGAKSDFGPSVPLYVVIDKDGAIRAGSAQFDIVKKVLEELLR